MNPVTRGVVAGGHPDTVRAGAEVLRAGGNAADAAVAAVAASLCAEASLTGLGAGGFALVREPDGRAELLDFFVAAPGLGRTPADRDSRSHLYPYEVPFRSAVQVFNVGPSSCATPGMPWGLATLHERHGRLPFAEVLAPAIRLAREGAVLVEQQDYLHEILKGILTSDDGAGALFAPGGRLLGSGRRLRFPDLAEALDALAREGVATFATGRYSRHIAEFFEARGGLITQADLAEYRVEVREPVSVAYHGYGVLTNPPPSSGGTLIAHTLSLLDARDLARMDADELAEAIVGAMVATDEVRHHLTAPPGAPPAPAEAAEAARAPGNPAPPSPGGLSSAPPPPASPGNTTHVCAIDEEGRAVSVTSSCGSGSGVIVDGAGFYMNNMMGEEDLNPLGFFKVPPGERLTSMMSPTIVYSLDTRSENHTPSLLAIGSAGSERLRSAIVQVLVNMIDLRMPAQAAVDRPRLHHHQGTIHLEGGTPEAVACALEARGRAVHRWPVTDLFFGGTQVATFDARGGRPGGRPEFDGGGDPRRGGRAVVV